MVWKGSCVIETAVMYLMAVSKGLGSKVYTFINIPGFVLCSY